MPHHAGTRCRYFPTREDLLWGIFAARGEAYGRNILERVERQETCCGRFAACFDVLADIFRQLRKIFPRRSFGSRDTVRLLEEKFRDGTIREDLPPHATCISLVYSASGLAGALAKNAPFLPHKYATEAVTALCPCSGACARRRNEPPRRA